MIQNHATRRIAAGAIGGAALLLVLGLLHHGQFIQQVAALPAPPASTTTPENPANLTYTGTSRKGDFSAAIDAAVAKVPVPCCDRVVSWSLKGVSGQRGGIDGRNVITVTIEAHID